MSKEKITYCEKYRKPYPRLRSDIPKTVGTGKVDYIEVVEVGSIVIHGEERAYSTVRIIHPAVKQEG